MRRTRQMVASLLGLNRVADRLIVIQLKLQLL